MPHARACNLLNREQLQKMKDLQCHPKFRVRTTYSMKLADDAKEKTSNKQVYEKLLAGEWFMAEACQNCSCQHLRPRWRPRTAKPRSKNPTATDRDRGPRPRDRDHDRDRDPTSGVPTLPTKIEHFFAKSSNFFSKIEHFYQKI